MNKFRTHLIDRGIYDRIKDKDFVITLERSAIRQLPDGGISYKVSYSRAWHELQDVHNGVLVDGTSFVEIMAFSEEDMMMVQLKHSNLILKKWDKNTFLSKLGIEFNRIIREYGHLGADPLQLFSYWANVEV